MLQILKTTYNKPSTALKANKPIKKNSCFSINEMFLLESGETLDRLVISYSTYGQLNRNKDNVIWVCHALTADSNPDDWWPGLIGEKDFYNPQEYFIVCANVIGSPYGSTSPLNCEIPKRYDDFPTISIRDNIAAFSQLREYLGIEHIHTLIGGSLGGQQAMEWAISEPDLFDHLVLLATCAVMSPWATAFNQSQRLAIEADTSWRNKESNAASNGLKAARSIALLSYRNNNAYNNTQADCYDFGTDRKAVSYQNYQGDKLVQRFNAYSYHSLTKTMDSHDVGRNRKGLPTALGRIKAKTLVIAISSDLLFPVSDSETLAKFIPRSQIKVIHSEFGHDGFLIEVSRISNCLQKFYNNKTSILKY